MPHSGETPFDRRSFLSGSAASLFLAATHGPQSWATPGDASSQLPTSANTHRLLHLDLVTKAPLDEMKAFYTDLLGLETHLAQNQLTVQGGETTLTFSRADEETEAEKVFYHFAFNIPENKILAARKWQLERTPLVPATENLRDPAYPEDIIHFRHWDAHSVFFWDPAGNFVEYIARHTLANPAPGPFTTKDILYASEIVFVTGDVPVTALLLQETLDLPQYNGGSESFRALGDEHGLLLVIKQGRVMGFGTGKPIQTNPVHAKIRGGPKVGFEVERYPFRVSG